MRDGVPQNGMNAFYIDGVGAVGDIARLTDEDARHAHRVLRLRAGEEIYVTDSTGARFAAHLTEVSEDACRAALDEPLSDNEAPVLVTIYEGLPKADKLDFLAQKLTELGARALVPVKMERCVVKLDEKDGKKRQDRLQKIAREASKQCKRACAMEIAAPMTWAQLEKQMRAHDLLLAPWEDARGFSMKDAHALRPDAQNIGIVIGPEGGMSEKEIRALEALGARQITLGPRILRTETAAVAACTMAMMLWGDL